MNKDFVNKLTEIAFYALGAYEATNNQAFQVIANSANSLALEIREQKEPISDNPMLDKSINELDLDIRSYNGLRNASIDTVAQLINKTESDLLKLENIGKKTLKVIKSALAEHGLTLKQ